MRHIIVVLISNGYNSFIYFPLSGFNGPGKFFYGSVQEDVPQLDLNAKGCVYARYQPHGFERMAANEEEVVCYADAVLAQHFLPDRYEDVFCGCKWSNEGLSRYSTWLGQTLFIHLAIDGQRNAVYLNKC